MSLSDLPVIQPLILFALSFFLSVFCLPAFIELLRKYKMGKSIRDAESAPVMAALHQAKSGTPTMGGVIVWGVALFLVLMIGGLCALLPGTLACQLSFYSRAQTLLPLGAMLGAAVVGLVDDYWNIRRWGPKGGGLRMRHRVLSYLAVALIGAWWFYEKLGWQHLHIPFVGTFEIGLWYIPFFVLTVVATSLSVNETDGLDGLAGGPLLAAFGSYSVIAWSQGRTDLATLCAVICGGLVAFLWFNVNPARVFMGDTGAMSLGVLLAIVALMTNQPLLLLVIGFPFVIESLSVMIQLTSKKLRNGKRVFKSSPIHHHLEAIGWTEPQIVMRTWLISFIASAVGAVIALVDRL